MLKPTFSGAARELLATYPDDFKQRYYSHVARVTPQLRVHTKYTVQQYDEQHELFNPEVIVYIQYVVAKRETGKFNTYKINLNAPNWYRSLCRALQTKSITNAVGDSLEAMKTREKIMEDANCNFFAHIPFELETIDKTSLRFNEDTVYYPVRWWRSFIQDFFVILVHKLTENIMSLKFTELLNSNQYTPKMMSLAKELLTEPSRYEEFGCNFEEFLLYFCTRTGHYLSSSTLEHYIYHLICVPTRYKLMIASKYLQVHLETISRKMKLKADHITQFIGSLLSELFSNVISYIPNGERVNLTLYITDHSRQLHLRSDWLEKIKSDQEKQEPFSKITNPIAKDLHLIDLPFYFVKSNQTVHYHSLKCERSYIALQHTFKKKNPLQFKGDRNILDEVECTKCLKHLVIATPIGDDGDNNLYEIDNSVDVIHLSSIVVCQDIDGAPLVDLGADKLLKYKYIDPLNSTLLYRYEDSKSIKFREVVLNGPKNVSVLILIGDNYQ